MTLIDLLKKELQDKCSELNIEFVDSNTKEELVAKIIAVDPEAESKFAAVERLKKIEADKIAEADRLAQIEKDRLQAIENEKNFDMESYETVVRLTFEKPIRKDQRLKKEEIEALAEAKPKAFKNVGKKPLKTDTYRVNMKTIGLIEGLPTPESVVNEFSKSGQEQLFV